MGAHHRSTPDIVRHPTSASASASASGARARRLHIARPSKSYPLLCAQIHSSLASPRPPAAYTCSSLRRSFLSLSAPSTSSKIVEPDTSGRLGTPRRRLHIRRPHPHPPHPRPPSARHTSHTKSLAESCLRFTSLLKHARLSPPVNDPSPLLPFRHPSTTRAARYRFDAAASRTQRSRCSSVRAQRSTRRHLSFTRIARGSHRGEPPGRSHTCIAVGPHPPIACLSLLAPAVCHGVRRSQALARKSAPRTIDAAMPCTRHRTPMVLKGSRRRIYSPRAVVILFVTSRRIRARTALDPSSPAARAPPFRTQVPTRRMPLTTSMPPRATVYMASGFGARRQRHTSLHTTALSLPHVHIGYPQRRTPHAARRTSSARLPAHANIARHFARLGAVPPQASRTRALAIIPGLSRSFNLKPEPCIRDLSYLLAQPSAPTISSDSRFFFRPHFGPPSRPRLPSPLGSGQRISCSRPGKGGGSLTSQFLRATGASRRYFLHLLSVNKCFREHFYRWSDWGKLVGIYLEQDELSTYGRLKIGADARSTV